MIHSSRINSRLPKLINCQNYILQDFMFNKDLFSWSCFVIYILKTHYLGNLLIFTGYILDLDSFHFCNLSRSKHNVKSALLQFQIQLKNWGVLKFTNYQYYWVFLFLWLSCYVCYISQITLLTLCHTKKQESSDYDSLCSLYFKFWRSSHLFNVC